MQKIINKEACIIGLAMFSMFFGAGNVIFPLALGQYAGDKNVYAILGLLITAVIMPFAGVLAMILFDGNYKQFFGRLGKWPGFLLSFLIISLLGPLGSTPRCIALSYSALKGAMPGMSPTLFSAVACAIIFLLTIKKNRILSILGTILTPILLGSLAIIICIGLMTTGNVATVDSSHMDMFWHGLKEGYSTMDLLAAFFFSSSILKAIKTRHRKDQSDTAIALKASAIGAILLSIVYIGFSFIASYHGAEIVGGKDELLSAITLKIAGPSAGFLVRVTVSIACLTTAIALISVFADFLQKDVLHGKISYEWCLFGSLLVTFFVSTFEFTGISAFLNPILEICYPLLILLTFANLAYYSLTLRKSRG